MSSFREGNGKPLQYTCLENPMDGEAWWATVHGVATSRSRLSDFTFTFHFHGNGEGNGNPLQCSCLENPRDGRAWWAAVYGVAQSQTRLKWLSSMSSLEKYLFSFLAHFLIGLFMFLVLSCMSCLYILEISSLSVASFAIIFSYPEGCLFTLLIVSFVVQKLLRLIRSHLIIFGFIEFSY